jgi:hypothetical protein
MVARHEDACESSKHLAIAHRETRPDADTTKCVSRPEFAKIVSHDRAERGTRASDTHNSEPPWPTLLSLPANFLIRIYIGPYLIALGQFHFS